MFKNPFSFDGRIRRTEYGLSFLIYLAVYFTILAVAEGAPSSGGFLVLILIVPLLWFFWAQGAKRCHDIDRNGWWQIIPFYFLFLLFEDGHPARNEYGSNPKHPEEIDVLESETLDGHLKN
jgi:uncharacterized membrane protein YhaH (DUF805 family)